MNKPLSLAHTNNSTDEPSMITQHDPISDSMKGNSTTADVDMPVAGERGKQGKSNIFKIGLLLIGTLLAILLAVVAFLMMPNQSSKSTSKNEKAQTPVQVIESPFGPELDSEPVQPPVSQPIESEVEQTILTGNDIQLDMNIQEDLSPTMRAALYGDKPEQIETQQEMLQSENSNFEKGISSNPGLDLLAEGTSANTVAIEKLQFQFDGIKKQAEANTDQLIANQKAITQTAQLIVSINKTIQDMKKELIQVRSIAFDNQDSIKAIEATIKENKKTGPLGKEIQVSPTGRELVDITKKSESIIDPFEAQRNGQKLKPHVPVYPNSGEPRSMVEAKPVANKLKADPVAPVSNAVVLSKLWVMAVHDNKAVVYDQDPQANGKLRQYLLRAGEWYKDLGEVTKIDHAESKVYGRFDNGSEWVIAKR